MFKNKLFPPPKFVQTFKNFYGQKEGNLKYLNQTMAKCVYNLSIQASVGKGGRKSLKNGPGGASLAMEPPTKFGALVPIGTSLGPVDAKIPVYLKTHLKN